MTTETLSYDPIETSEEYLGYSRINLKFQRQVITPYTHSTIIYAQTDQGERVVVKLSGINGSLREWEGLNKTHNIGLLVPKPYALVRDNTNRTGVIMKYVDGKSLYSLQSDRGRFGFGELTHRMHQLTPISGIEWARSQKNDFNYSQTNGLDLNRSLAILSLLSDQARLYCQTVSPVFNHNDLHDGQTIVTKESVNLIDFEKWVEESPLNDIAIYIFHSIRTGQSAMSFEYFLKGYLGEGTFSELEKSALMFYLLFISSRALIHFYQQGDTYVETAKNTHEKILEYIGGENIWKNF